MVQFMLSEIVFNVCFTSHKKINGSHQKQSAVCKETNVYTIPFKRFYRIVSKNGFGTREIARPTDIN